MYISFSFFSKNKIFPYYYLFHIHPQNFYGLNWTLYPILMCVMGGVGSTIGPVIGAVFLSAVFELAKRQGQVPTRISEIARVQAKEGVKSVVRIVAVTKGHPVEFVHASAAVGLVEVGENRVQEALTKQDSAGDVEVNWHLIGHLQSNKAKHIPGRFTMVHSVDSVRIAEALARAADRNSEDGGSLDVLIQVNVGKEPQKNGCEPETAAEIASYIAETPSLVARGLMTMAPFNDDEREQRQVFEALRLLREKLENEGFDLPELSMGMSNDFRAAVAEGATILRLGTVLFGERAA